MNKFLTILFLVFASCSNCDVIEKGELNFIKINDIDEDLANNISLTYNYSNQASKEINNISFVVSVSEANTLTGKLTNGEKFDFETPLFWTLKISGSTEYKISNFSFSKGKCQG